MFTDQSEELGVVGIINSQEFGSGLSTYDYDNDGLDDISLCNSTGEILFYHNNGDGFTLTSFGIISPGQAKSILWVDYDNDGLIDLFLTTFQGQNVLYKNMGDFVFEPRTAEAGLPVSNDFNSGASFGDYDRDGYLDLYICKYANNFTNPPVSSEYYNKLYHNNGDGTFSDVTIESGVQFIPSLSLQSVWLDVNNDNWPDLHIINDRNPGNFLFLNNGDGTFSDVTLEYLMSFPQNCVMSNSVSDFDHDGDLDIFMTNSGGPNTPNLLAVNYGTGFQEEALDLGLSLFEFTWGATWIDADNDSWEDIYCVLPGTVSNRFFLNDEGNVFIDSPDEISVESEYTCYAPAKGDFNNDGYADIAIQSISPNHSYVMMNAGGENNYIKTTLRGTVSNELAIGAWIKLYFNDQTTVHYTLCGENYHGQNSQHLLFGLGNTTEVDSLKVLYPSGFEDKYYNLSIDTAYQLTEGETYLASVFSEGGTSFCSGDSLLLDAGDHLSYLWENGDTTRYSMVNTPGIHAVVVTNEFGIAAMADIEIYESLLPQVSVNLISNLCFGDSTGSIELTNQIEIPADSVIWSNDFIGNPNDSIPAGEYEYIFIDINGCIDSGLTTLIAPAEMQFFTTTTPEVSGDSNGSISISIFGGTPPFEIFIANQLTTSPITDLQGGDYIITVFDSNLCEEQFTVTVDEVLSIDTKSTSDLNIYPNPAKDNISILSSGQIQSIEFISLDGKSIAQLDKSASGTYDIHFLEHGLYFLRISFQDGNYAIVRIAIQ